MAHRSSDTHAGPRRTALRVVAVLVLGAAATASACALLRTQLERAAHVAFEREVALATETLELRLKSYAGVLQAAAELLQGPDENARETLRAYVEGSEILAQLPGIQGVGYAPRVLPQQALAHVEAVRRAGLATYAIWPLGERPVYFPIAVIEPLTGHNSRALGYDMYSEPVRRAAMDRAEANGQPSLSGVVHLVQDADEPDLRGFLLYVPVHMLQPGDSALKPTRVLRGFVFAPFRARDQLDGALAHHRLATEFTLHDGDDAANDDALLYRSVAHDRSGPPAWSATRTLDLYGRHWLLRADAPPFAQAVPRARWLYDIAWIGGALTLLLALAIAVNGWRAWQRARAANEATP